MNMAMVYYDTDRCLKLNVIWN